MTIRTFRSRPVEVRAVQWTGDNADELEEFAEDNFGELDPEDRANCDDPEATAQVFDDQHNTWKLVYDLDWIIQLASPGKGPSRSRHRPAPNPAPTLATVASSQRGAQG